MSAPLPADEKVRPGAAHARVAGLMRTAIGAWSVEYRSGVATFAEMDSVARSLPEVEAFLSPSGRPEYKVRGKAFLLMRPPRKDAVDPDTGELMDDVLMFRTIGLAGKEEWLAKAALPLFTTPHFNGWPAVVLRARDLGEVSLDALRSLVVDAWRAQAPKSLARQLQQNAP